MAKLVDFWEIKEILLHWKSFPMKKRYLMNVLQRGRRGAQKNTQQKIQRYRHRSVPFSLNLNGIVIKKSKAKVEV